MIPQILQQLNTNNPIQQVAQFAKNPLTMMPQYQQAMNLIQQAGGDARAAFYQLAKEKGVDPNQILSMLK